MSSRRLRMRRYQGESDYERIRAFLQRVFLLNDRRELSWQAYRFDYWRWHVIQNLGHGLLERDVFLWQSTGEEIVAVLNPEGPGHAYLQVDPRYKHPGLEEAMIAVAEENLRTTSSKGDYQLKIFANEQDLLRRKILIDRGYRLSGSWEHHHRRSISSPIQEPVLPEGYKIRSLRGRTDLPERSLVSWKAFHPHESMEEYEGWEWYLNVQRAPLYRPDLDLIVLSAEGEFASFCTIWFDVITRSGSFEPVGTSPKHQRLGLGKAVIYSGLRKLQELGAEMAFVGSGAEPASSFYTAIGFQEREVSQMWVKEWS